MSIRVAVTCPYCKRPMAASPAFAGQTVACPNCRREFVLSPPAVTPPREPSAPTQQTAPGPPAYSEPMSAASSGAAVAAPPASSRLSPSTQQLPPAMPSAAATRAPALAPFPPPPPPNTARFKTAGGQAPAIAPTADGKLPTLQLADARAANKAGDAEKPVPLWVACLAVLASTGLSAFLLLGDMEGQQAAGSRRSAARHDLMQYYGSDAAQLRPFQVLLREAQQAHSRGELVLERQRYREVLALLRAEGRSQFEGLTGTPQGDKKLTEQLSTLLADE